jgi:uncharacterized protein YggE
MNRKFFIGIAFLLMLFSVISCTTIVQESQNIVSVSGVGDVSAQPDMVHMEIYFSHIAPTIKEAKRVVEQKMQQILKILQEENIDDKFIKTKSLYYGVESEYTSGRRITVGQRASQTIAVTVTDIINNPERFPLLLEKITTVDRIEIENIEFDIENKAELFKQSRELAYQKAFDKAKQYAELSGRKIGKVLAISEEDPVYYGYELSRANSLSFDIAGDISPNDSFIPTGERRVTSEIKVVFSLK